MNAGRIGYEINVEDKSAAGIKTASDNLNRLASNAQNLRNAFNPAQTMQAGVFGLSLAGLGAMGSQMTSITNISKQLGSATMQACNGIRTMGKESSSTLQTMTHIGTTMATISGSIVVLGAAIPTVISLTTSIRQSNAVYKATIALHKEYATVCTLSEAATELLTASGIKNATVNQVNAAQILLMSNAEAGAVVKKNMSTMVDAKLIAVRTMLQGSTAGLTVATIKESAARVINAALAKAQASAHSICTVVKNGEVLSTIRNNAMLTINNALLLKNKLISMACSTATKLMGFAAKGAASGFLSLSSSLLANPFIAAAAGIVALIAGLGALVSWLVSAKSAAQQQAEAMEKVRLENEKTRESCELYTKRMEQLNEKEKLSAREKEEMAKYVKEVNSKYAGLNLTIDELTGKVKNADGAFVNLKKVMADAAQTDLENSIKAQNKLLDEQMTKLAYGETGWVRWAGAGATLGYVDTGDQQYAKMSDEDKKKRQKELSENGQTGWARWWGGFVGMDNTKEIKDKIKESQDLIDELETKKINNAINRDAGGIEAEKKTAEEKRLYGKSIGLLINIQYK